MYMHCMVLYYMPDWGSIMCMSVSGSKPYLATWATRHKPWLQQPVCPRVGKVSGRLVGIMHDPTNIMHSHAYCACTVYIYYVHVQCISCKLTQRYTTILQNSLYTYTYTYNNVHVQYGQLTGIASTKLQDSQTVYHIPRNGKSRISTLMNAHMNNQWQIESGRWTHWATTNQPPFQSRKPWKDN